MRTESSLVVSILILKDHMLEQWMPIGYGYGIQFAYTLSKFGLGEFVTCTWLPLEEVEVLGQERARDYKRATSVSYPRVFEGIENNENKFE